MNNIRRDNNFRSVFENFYPRLMGVACRFVDRNIAKDIVQDVFITYWEKQEDIHQEQLHSFLFKCVQNKCLDHIKHENIVEDYEKISIAEARIDFINRTTSSNETWETLTRNNLKEVIENAIAKLPPKCREAFRYCFFHDMTYKETAEIMGISHRTVETHVHKAIAFLREELNPSQFAVVWGILLRLIIN